MKIKYTYPDKFEMLSGTEWLYITNPDMIPGLKENIHANHTVDNCWFYNNRVVADGSTFDVEDNSIKAEAKDAHIARIFDTTGNFKKFPGPGTMVVTLYVEVDKKNVCKTCGGSKMIVKDEQQKSAPACPDCCPSEKAQPKSEPINLMGGMVMADEWDEINRAKWEKERLNQKETTFEWPKFKGLMPEERHDELASKYLDRICNDLQEKWNFPMKQAREISRDIFYTYILPIYEVGEPGQRK